MLKNAFSFEVHMNAIKKDGSKLKGGGRLEVIVNKIKKFSKEFLVKSMSILKRTRLENVIFKSG